MDNTEKELLKIFKEEFFQTLPTSKIEVEELEEMARELVTEGWESALKAYVVYSATAKALTGAMKAIFDEALAEAQQEGKTFDYLGFEVQVKNGGVNKYMYDDCGDPIYNRIKSSFTEVDKKRKDRETFLKSIKDMEIITDPETGETVEVYAPAKTFKSDSITVKPK
jgi:hypothetical protein